MAVLGELLAQQIGVGEAEAVRREAIRAAEAWPTTVPDRRLRTFSTITVRPIPVSK